VIFARAAGSSEEPSNEAALRLAPTEDKEGQMTSRNKLRIVGILVAALVGVLAIALPGTASARDRNHDRIPDKWERNHHLSLHKNQAKRDQDRDSLKNRKEFKARTDPRDADTDGDGVPDGEENAGTIASFDGTTLTINLFDGSSISGMVTQGTEIKCEATGGDDNDNAGDDDSGDDDNSGHGGGGGDDHRTASAMSTSDDGGGNDDNGGDDDGGDDNGGECTTADLTPDTVVQEAELDLSNGQATFEEVKLIK
jgi:hypothetical protein